MNAFLVNSFRGAGFPLPALTLALLCAAYLLAGVLGHDPWKADDAVHLGIAWDIHSGGGVLLPKVGGEPIVGTTPLYHWVAAGIAWTLQWVLPFHDGARLATPFFGALFLFFLYRGAKAFGDRDAGLVAPAVAIGTLGLLVPIHDAQPAIAVMAMAAMTYWGLALLPGKPLPGAVALGVGCGGAFFAGGLTGVAPLLPLLLAPLLRRAWLAFFIALYTAIAVAALWPTFLALRTPEYLAGWWREELALAAFHKGFSSDHLELLAWFSWPLLPLAAWAAWVQRRQWQTWSVAVPVVGSIVALIWFLGHEARPLQALPMLTPLALLAAAGAHRLRRGAANALDWFGMMTFTLIIGLVWLGGIAMWTGWPPQISRNFAKLEPGFLPQFSYLALGLALVFTLGWLAALVRLPKSPWRAAVRWTAGLTAMWGVLVALWMPWIDYGKTYRGVMRSLRTVLPKDACVASRNVGLAQRALVDYFTGVHLRTTDRGECRWLMVQGSARHEAAPAGWTHVWEGHRPGDRSERLRLYRREE